MVTLYAMGSNGSGQLGIGHTDDTSTPVRCIFPKDVQLGGIAKIAAGGNHTLVLTTSGELFEAGENSNLTGSHDGPRSASELHTFHKVKLKIEDEICETFSSCSATWEASTVVLSDGRVVTAGNGNKGELGLGPGVATVTDPQVVLGFPHAGLQVVELSAGMEHTLAVLSNGEVWGWGNGKNSQLGQPSQQQWSPRKIPNIHFHAVRAVCGKGFSLIVGPSSQGDVQFLGSNKFSLHSDTPESIPGWKEVGSSWGGLYVLFDSGSMAAWGRNDHKQLPPSNLNTLKHIAIGSEHTIALSNEGDILTWGWGEHGNCGHRSSETDYDFSLNTIMMDKSVVTVGAGCATSWLVTEE